MFEPATAAARYRLPLITLVGAFVLTGCGGDEESEVGGESENDPPALSGEPAASVVVGSAYSFKPAASDPDEDALLFGVDGLPPWAEFDSLTGTLNGSPGPEDVGTYRGIVVWVTDGETETLLPAFDIAVAPATPTANSAPTLSGTPARSVVAGETYLFVPQADDADGEPLAFTITNRPTWATFDPQNGKLEGIPPTESAGTYRDIVIAASDGRATTTLPPFEITVRLPNVNGAPTISGEPPATVAAGTEYAFTPTASDVDGDMLTFAVENAPPWASFDPVSGQLAGLPDEADVGTYGEIVIKVSDGVAAAALGPFSIAVTPPSANTPPTISGSPGQTALQGENYAFTPSAFDADGDPLSFSIANKPVWASFDASTGKLSGIPDGDDVGPFGNIVITVSDGTASAALPAFSITVEAAEPANAPPTISGTPPTTVVQGTAYSFEPTAADPDGSGLTFEVANLPSWASFDTATGQLTGTPGAGDVGTYSSIQISVTDGELVTALPAFDIRVEAIANGTATLTWTAPTLRTDGSSLTNLAGFNVYWGSEAGSYPNKATVGVGVTTYVVENLAPGTWYFVTTAFDTANLESAFSNVASKTIP